MLASSWGELTPVRVTVVGPWYVKQTASITWLELQAGGLVVLAYIGQVFTQTCWNTYNGPTHKWRVTSNDIDRQWIHSQLLAVFVHPRQWHLYKGSWSGQETLPITCPALEVATRKRVCIGVECRFTHSTQRTFIRTSTVDATPCRSEYFVRLSLLHLTLLWKFPQNPKVIGCNRLWM